jgi:hypothetical protein
MLYQHKVVANKRISELEARQREKDPAGFKENV